MAPILAKAAVAAGANALFLEVHPEPEKAKSDAAPSFGALVELLEDPFSRNRPQARTVIANSSAPAAPSRCPCIDFVELTASFAACAPNASLSASISTLSPTVVPVACAFT